MSITNEPQLGAPQTEAGAQILQQGTNPMQQQFNGMVNMPGMVGMANMGQANANMGMQQNVNVSGPNMTMSNMQQNPGTAQNIGQTPTNSEKTEENHILGAGQVGNVNTIQNPNVIPNMQPQTQQVNEFPTIPDNNPVAQFPENAGSVGILTEGTQNQGMQIPQNPNMGIPGMQQNVPGMNPNQGMQQNVPGMNPNQGMQMQQNPNMGMQQNQGMGMNPNMGIPNMQQNPNMGMQQNPNMGMQHIPGSSAPGFNNGSYLQNQGGMFGPTPTGHPEKQKFQLQFTLIYAKVRPTQKGTLITTGLIANPADRNAPAINFVCFSGSATKQIQILEDASRSNYTTIEKAGGQPIWVEASWQWNDKNKNQPPAWQLMCDNFIFINDQNLRQVAENWVPPVPPSPMDMLNGGQMQMNPNMGMQHMQQNIPGMNPNMGMQQMQQGIPGMNPNMGMQQGIPGMQQGMNPNMGMPNNGYGQ